MDERFENADIVTHMDASSPVEFGGFQEPEIVATEVAERHCVPENVLLQGSLVFVFGFLLFLYMLFN